jgi:hypothetical protein
VKAKYGEYCNDRKYICDTAMGEGIMAEYKCIDGTCNCPIEPQSPAGLTWEDEDGCVIVAGQQCFPDGYPSSGKCVKNADCVEGVCVCNTPPCISTVSRPPRAKKKTVDADDDDEEDEETLNMKDLGISALETAQGPQSPQSPSSPIHDAIRKGSYNYNDGKGNGSKTTGESGSSNDDSTGTCLTAEKHAVRIVLMGAVIINIVIKILVDFFSL